MVTDIAEAIIKNDDNVEEEGSLEWIFRRKADMADTIFDIFSELPCLL